MQPQMQTESPVLTIYAISDTHGKNSEIQKLLMKQQKCLSQSGLEHYGDIFIHAGDFTEYSKQKHFNQFVELSSQLRFRHKLIIPGNHEILLDGSMDKQSLRSLGQFHVPKEMERDRQIQMLEKKAGFRYFEHHLLEIEGLRLFLSAYTPASSYSQTGFQLQEGAFKAKEKEIGMKEAWQGVPNDIDILITHGPPYKILDWSVYSSMHAGSRTLRNYVKQTGAKCHIFGHIHQASGHTTFEKKTGIIQCYNVAQKMTKITVHK